MKEKIARADGQEIYLLWCTTNVNQIIDFHWSIKNKLHDKVCMYKLLQLWSSSSSLLFLQSSCCGGCNSFTSRHAKWMSIQSAHIKCNKINNHREVSQKIRILSTKARSNCEYRILDCVVAAIAIFFFRIFHWLQCRLMLT